MGSERCEWVRSSGRQEESKYHTQAHINHLHCSINAAVGEEATKLLTHKVHDVHQCGSTARVKLHTNGDGFGDHMDREGLCSFQSVCVSVCGNANFCYSTVLKPKKVASKGIKVFIHCKELRVQVGGKICHLVCLHARQSQISGRAGSNCLSNCTAHCKHYSIQHAIIRLQHHQYYRH